MARGNADISGIAVATASRRNQSFVDVFNPETKFSSKLLMGSKMSDPDNVTEPPITVRADIGLEKPPGFWKYKESL